MRLLWQIRIKPLEVHLMKSSKAKTSSVRQQHPARIKARELVPHRIRREVRSRIPQEILNEFKGVTFLPPVGTPNKVAKEIIKAMRETLSEEENR